MEFESHLVPHSYGLLPHLSEKLSKLQLDGQENGLSLQESPLLKNELGVNWFSKVV